MPQLRTRRRAFAASTALLLLTACGTEADAPAASDVTEAPSTQVTDTGEEGPTGATDVAAPSPRLAITYDGGVQVLDATTLEVLADEELDGFTRLDPQPQVFTMQGTAYLTDPAGTAIHAVDIETGEIWASADLDVVPNELKGVTGEADDHDHGDDE